MSASLYLIPVTLSETPIDKVLPAYNTQVIESIKYFIVENVRTARRFLRSCSRDIDIDSLTFFTLNQHTQPEEVSTFLEPLSQGSDMGIISEAGCPAIADPGADVVAIAQQKNIKVVPLVGPSSIIMSVMASGFNGQSFAFNGYLPIDGSDRVKAMKDMERRIFINSQTQIFIETPYRNNRLIADLLQNMRKDVKLCIASDITGEHEYIVTKTLAQWAKKPITLEKVPTIFLLYR